MRNWGRRKQAIHECANPPIHHAPQPIYRCATFMHRILDFKKSGGEANMRELHNESTMGAAELATGALTTQEKQSNQKPVKKRGRRLTLANQALKRYNLILPEQLYEAIQDIAEKQHSTVMDQLRKFIKLGILTSDIANDPNAKLIIREGKKEREIIVV
jgi:hypothetical protein